MLGGGFSFLCGTQNRSQTLPYNDFLTGLYGHGYEFDVIGLFMFFPVRIAFVDRCHQTWIVGTEHFDDGIVLAQLPHAVRRAEAPG